MPSRMLIVRPMRTHSIARYFQISKQASWALLIVTMVLACSILFAMVFVSGLSVFLQQLMNLDEHPWRIDIALSLATAVMLPALLLARFYFVVAARLPSPLYSVIGWIFSATYHAALTCLFVFFMPGTIGTSMSPIRVPMSLFSGAAFIISLYLLIGYPRPFKLPPKESTNAA